MKRGPVHNNIFFADKQQQKVARFLDALNLSRLEQQRATDDMGYHVQQPSSNADRKNGRRSR